MFTATGSPAICVGYVSMLIASAVCVPPSPPGPIPNLLIFSSISFSKSRTYSTGDSSFKSLVNAFFAREGRPIGSAGPTTASRMDKYAPDLLDLGLKGMIGKGKRSQAVIDGIVRNGAVYFAAVGGAGAILSKCIKKSTVIAYDDLGTEAIRELEVENLPVIVVIDSEGNNLYETAIKEYSRV